MIPSYLVKLTFKRLLNYISERTKEYTVLLKKYTLALWVIFFFFNSRSIISFGMGAPTSPPFPFTCCSTMQNLPIGSVLPKRALADYNPNLSFYMLRAEVLSDRLKNYQILSDRANSRNLIFWLITEYNYIYKYTLQVCNSYFQQKL